MQKRELGGGGWGRSSKTGEVCHMLQACVNCMWLVMLLNRREQRRDLGGGGRSFKAGNKPRPLLSYINFCFMWVVVSFYQLSWWNKYTATYRPPPHCFWNNRKWNPCPTLYPSYWENYMFPDHRCWRDYASGCFISSRLEPRSLSKEERRESSGWGRYVSRLYWGLVIRTFGLKDYI